TAGPPVSMRTIARLLRERLGDRARRVPTLPMPDWVMRLIGRFNVEVHDLTPLLGVQRPVTSAKARDRLGWTPRPWEEAVLASAESLLA
ncbi:MAG TPA: aldehyde reductase, partial [Myxococcota bacterium]|nr:aldehyde reductase [Myxococcota bacterium]